MSKQTNLFNEHQIVRKQSGIALVMALLLLLVVTLIGVTSLRSSLMNEQMTRNILLRQTAFEAAEIALLAGERDVEDHGELIANRMFDAFKGANTADRTAAEQCQMIEGSLGVGGICSPVQYASTFNPAAPQADHWKLRDDLSVLDVWTTTNRHRTTLDVSNRLGLSDEPKYIIEFMGFLPEPGVASACDAGGADTMDSTESSWPYCEADSMQFRITALGTAGNNNEARVMLQSVYELQ